MISDEEVHNFCSGAEYDEFPFLKDLLTYSNSLFEAPFKSSYDPYDCMAPLLIPAAPAQTAVLFP